MPGLRGVGGGGIFRDQILFHKKSRFRQVLTLIHGNIVFAAKLETKVISLHKIEVVKILSFLLNKYAVHSFWLLPVIFQVHSVRHVH